MTKDFLFGDIIEWLKTDFSREHWITLYKEVKSETERFTICGILVPNKLLGDFFEYTPWSLNASDFKPGYVHYAERKPVYRRWGIEDDYEPIIYRSFYNTLYPDSINVIEEFKLFFNLNYDPKSHTYISIDESSNENILIKEVEGDIIFSTLHLRQFLAAKKMNLGLQFDCYRFSSAPLHSLGLSEGEEIEIKDTELYYKINFQNTLLNSNKLQQSNSRVLAKKIIRGLKKVEPLTFYEEMKNKKYCDFIVDENIDTGKSIYHSCNPAMLADNFGKNSQAPHFLTPIFFRRDVLLKYFQDSERFSIKDGDLIRRGSWILPIDNNLKEYVSVYLGDLGRNLPYDEQSYWSSFNVPYKGGISTVKFDRDIRNRNAEPLNLDLIFKNKYDLFKKHWCNKFGFSLYKELKTTDEYCLSSVRLPLYENSLEFDYLVLCLTKLLVDYLDEKEIYKRIDPSNIPPESRGLNKLQELLVNCTPSDSESVIFLRKLQALRSTGSAHQKGDDYLKALKKLGLESKTYHEQFSIILKMAIEMFEELEKIEECPINREA